MLRRDEHDYILDQKGDGGDSARAQGLFSLFSPENYYFGVLVLNYVSLKGECFRHPNQKPWDNAKNFSRDQLICLVAGLWARKEPLAQLKAREIFWAHAKRLFFCQNSERDSVGSKKMFRPHEFYKDSRPDATTLPMKFDWKSLKFKQTLFSNETHEVETRLVDGRDILLFDAIWHLILCARFKRFYVFGLVGIPWLCLSILGHRLSNHHEHNQIMSQCKVSGPWAVKLFKKMIPNWKEDLKKYWVEVRNCPEMYDLITKNF